MARFRAFGLRGPRSSSCSSARAATGRDAWRFRHAARRVNPSLNAGFPIRSSRWTDAHRTRCLVRSAMSRSCAVSLASLVTCIAVLRSPQVVYSLFELGRQFLEHSVESSPANVLGPSPLVDRNARRQYFADTNSVFDVRFNQTFSPLPLQLTQVLRVVVCVAGVSAPVSLYTGNHQGNELCVGHKHRSGFTRFSPALQLFVYAGLDHCPEVRRPSFHDCLRHNGKDVAVTCCDCVLRHDLCCGGAVKDDIVVAPVKLRLLKPATYQRPLVPSRLRRFPLV